MSDEKTLMTEVLPVPKSVIPSVSPRERVAQHWHRLVTTGAATANLAEGAITAQFIPVIFSNARQKGYGIEEIRVDDVPDVIRSRRYNESTHTFRHPLPPP